MSTALDSLIVLRHAGYDDAADEIVRLRRERDSLARRCARRFEETEVALVVAQRFADGWTAEEGLWWRKDLRASEEITEAELDAIGRLRVKGQPCD